MAGNSCGLQSGIAPSCSDSDFNKPSKTQSTVDANFTLREVGFSYAKEKPTARRPGYAILHNAANSLRKINLKLKEQCHEDFAVLGQFCDKIITLRL